MLVGFLALMLIIIYFELPGLMIKKLYKEMAAFLVICLIAAIYGSLFILKIPIPSPFELITRTASTFWKYVE